MNLCLRKIKSERIYVAVQNTDSVLPNVGGYLQCAFPWKKRCPVQRRMKMFYVDLSFIETLLNWRQVDYLHLPNFEQFPKDVTFHQVHFDPLRQAFGILIHSEEFEVIPDGDMFPVIKGLQEITTIQLKFEEIQ